MIFRKQFNTDHRNVLYFTPYLLSFQSIGESTTHRLYSYETVKLMVLFVYGTDFTRRMNIVFVPTSIQMMAVSIILFMSFAAFTLYLIRRKLQFHRNSVSLVAIDILIAFIGGGNLQMRHHVERWFFGILLLATFVINSLFVGDILSCFYRTLNEQISTFDQLTKINVPIYTSKVLAMNDDNLHEILRLVQFGLNIHTSKSI